MKRNVTKTRNLKQNAIIKNYDGVIEPRTVATILAKAKRLGLPEHMREDVVQQIAIDIVRFKHDPEKSNGASEMTVVAAITKHKILDIIRRMEFEKHFLYRKSKSVVLEYSEINQLQIKMDIISALNALPQIEREICINLATGQTINRISCAIGWKWEKTQQVVLSIRKRLTDMGLWDYLGDK